ncbi:uncharacterized protein LOC142175253 [Nicotiana tabacum]|uniref:Uncharacterized protein LOC142175253 n=1 Tax=Nicotiana tabacum TaxID=4097 RepID=A0AC58TL40_TOBAC
MELPWVVGGDFNVILSKDEKIGGFPVYPSEYEDFAFSVNSCELFDLGYKDNTFTRWNWRPNAEYHAPLLMSCSDQALKFVKPFKFLNFWTKHESFMEVIRQNWIADFTRDPFLMFKQKLKRVKIALSKWSKLTYGDIFKQLSIREDVVRVKKMLFEEEPTVENRIIVQQAQAKLKKYLSIEEQHWKQKVGMTWFAEGERNTRFFHNHVNGKRKKLQFKRFQKNDGARIDSQDLMADVAVEFFQKQFTQEDDPTSYELLNNIPTMVASEENLNLCRSPTREKVKATVFALSGESTSGPNGFSGIFFQVCWDIVWEDIHNMLKLFYGGSSMPKSITLSNLVLLPKKPMV